MMSATPPVELDYIGLSKISDADDGCYPALKTELSLSLPGSVSPDKTPAKSVLGLSLFGEEAQAQPQLPNGYAFNSVKSSNVDSGRGFASYGGKRGFADASGKWGLSVNCGSDGAGKNANIVEIGGGVGLKPGQVKDMDIDGESPSLKSVQEKKPANELGSAPAAKAQVIGWPPIRSFRKNTMASAGTKNNNEADADGKSGSTCLYVKVSMDGAPYLRKVDLKLYNNYMELSLALKKMFSCFPGGKDGPKDSHLNLKDLSQGSECVLTYEDKDGDWMLVGDVPWEMFTSTCKRLRIMKGSEVIGLAPRNEEQ